MEYREDAYAGGKIHPVEKEYKREYLQENIFTILSKSDIRDSTKVAIFTAVFTPLPRPEDWIIIDRVYGGWDEIEDYD